VGLGCQLGGAWVWVEWGGVGFGTGTTEGTVRFGGGGCGGNGWMGGVRFKAGVRRGWGECLAGGEVGWVGRECRWGCDWCGILSLGMTDPGSSGLTPLIHPNKASKKYLYDVI